MRKIYAALLIVLLFAMPVSAAEFRLGSGEQTATANIVTGTGILTQIIVATDGTNAPTINLYDTAATETTVKLIPSWTVTTSSADRMQVLPIDNERFFKGIYATVSGTASYVILYQK